MEKDTKKVVGKFVGHLLGGAALKVIFLLISAAEVLLTEFVTKKVGNTAFTNIFDSSDTFQVFLETVILVWWFAYSLVKLVKELME